jgi:hypothetical protein
MSKRGWQILTIVALCLALVGVGLDFQNVALLGGHLDLGKETIK